VLAMNRLSFIYLIGSASRRTIYTGVTTNLHNRVFEHKNDLIEGFTSKYKCHRLVYFETFGNVTDAIAREKEVKGWRREKKNKLVESKNPGWKDLAADWYPQTLLKDGLPVKDGVVVKEERKVPRACSRAEDSARFADGPRDDDT
jgi:putative endonuclease